MGALEFHLLNRFEAICNCPLFQVSLGYLLSSRLTQTTLQGSVSNQTSKQINRPQVQKEPGSAWWHTPGTHGKILAYNNNNKISWQFNDRDPTIRNTGRIDCPRSRTREAVHWWQPGQGGPGPPCTLPPAWNKKCTWWARFPPQDDILSARAHQVTIQEYLTQPLKVQPMAEAGAGVNSTVPLAISPPNTGHQDT